jgi:poly-beta-1,6-N-acetyl-D-glucosamine synthase
MIQQNPTEFCGHSKIWWNFLSHKIFRLVVPYLLIYLFTINFILLTNPIFIFTLIIQVSFYGLAFFAWINPVFRLKSPINLIFFFVSLNYAALVGSLYFLSGNSSKTWKKAI